MTSHSVPATPLHERVKAAAAALSDRFLATPAFGWFAEGGVGEIEEEGARIEAAVSVKELTGFPPSASGRFLRLRFGNRPLIAFEGGRLLSEGAQPSTVAFPVWVLAEAGVRVLCVSGGCGALDPSHEAPSLAGIEDHLNLSGLTPFEGGADEELGPKFPDLANLYDPELLESAAAAARRADVPFATAVLAATAGPHFETAAERRFFRQAGAHVVAQSIALPAMAAAHAGVRTLGLGLVVEPVRPPHRFADPALLAAHAARASRDGLRLLSRWLEEVPSP